MKKWWCKRFHRNFWSWKTWSWGSTDCICTRCGRQWVVNKNVMIKE